jgi:hypothetical protein
MFGKGGAAMVCAKTEKRGTRADEIAGLRFNTGKIRF